jgi:hypothetical protein
MTPGSATFPASELIRALEQDDPEHNEPEGLGAEHEGPARNDAQHGDSSEQLANPAAEDLATNGDSA